jgi:hypothetical protein
VTREGDQMTAPLSNLDLTKDLYRVDRVDIFLKLTLCLIRKPNILLADDTQLST